MVTRQFTCRNFYGGWSDLLDSTNLSIFPCFHSLSLHLNIGDSCIMFLFIDYTVAILLPVLANTRCSSLPWKYAHTHYFPRCAFRWPRLMPQPGRAGTRMLCRRRSVTSRQHLGAKVGNCAATLLTTSPERMHSMKKIVKMKKIVILRGSMGPPGPTLCLVQGCSTSSSWQWDIQHVL